MAGYTKNIAVIRGIKSGFSADGGQLSGLIKIENYRLFMRAEISRINFAPLTCGRYVSAVSDGKCVTVFEGDFFEGESKPDTSSGFVGVICFVNTEGSPGAMAVCGDFGGAAAECVREIERQEKLKNLPEAGAAYEDEAIAEENYYEYTAYNQGQGAVCADKEQKDGRGGREDEADFGLRKEPQTGENGGSGEALSRAAAYDGTENSADGAPSYGGVRSEGGDGKTAASFGSGSGKAAGDRSGKSDDVAERIPLASDLKFYERMRGEIEGLFEKYPREEGLEEVVKGSRWVRITYGGDKYYVFGVICEDDCPAYICYGVPSDGACPSSLAGMAGFIPVGKGGYWVMYQDARTGASVKLNSV